MNLSPGIAKRSPEGPFGGTQLIPLLLLAIAALQARFALAEDPAPRFVLKAHQGAIKEVTFSPDGRTLATSGHGANDYSIKLWDVATQEVRTTLMAECPVGRVAYSPNGKLIAVACRKLSYKDEDDYSSLTIWDVSSGKKGRTVSNPAEHWMGYNLIFSPDSKTLLFGCWDRVIFWDVETWSVRSTIPVGRFPDFKMDLSPDGQLIATAEYNSKGNAMLLRDAVTGEVRNTLGTFKLPKNRKVLGWFGEPQFSPNGKYLAARASDRSVRVWYVSTGELVKMIPSSNDMVNSVRYSPDGKLLIAGYQRGEVVIWDSFTFEERKHLQAATGAGIGEFWILAFSPDGKLLATNGTGREKDTVKIWDVSQILSASPAKTPATKPSSRGVQSPKEPAKH